MRVALVLILLFLAGCSSTKKPATTAIPVPPQQAETAWQQHQQQLTALRHWQAEGKLAASRGTKGGNASFIWQQDGDYYQIKLFGPFGSGAVYITGGPRQVEIKEANGKITRAGSPEELLTKVAGWYVPVTGLRYWLRGLPSSEIPVTAQRVDNQGQLVFLHQQGWQIRYADYTTQTMPSLPGKLVLQNNEISVKMVVKSWKRIKSA